MKSKKPLIMLADPDLIINTEYGTVRYEDFCLYEVQRINEDRAEKEKVCAIYERGMVGVQD